MKTLIQFLNENSKPNPKVVLDSYIETGFWADFPDGEKKLGINKLDTASKRAAVKDVKKFLSLATLQLDTAFKSAGMASQAFWKAVGHDLWLTRNGHGAGFWDNPKVYGGQKNADALAKIAEKMGQVDLYVGDDGKVYIE